MLLATACRVGYTRRLHCQRLCGRRPLDLHRPERLECRPTVLRHDEGSSDVAADAVFNGTGVNREVNDELTLQHARGRSTCCRYEREGDGRATTRHRLL